LAVRTSSGQRRRWHARRGRQAGGIHFSTPSSPPPLLPCDEVADAVRSHLPSLRRVASDASNSVLFVYPDFLSCRWRISCLRSIHSRTATVSPLGDGSRPQPTRPPTRRRPKSARASRMPHGSRPFIHRSFSGNHSLCLPQIASYLQNRSYILKATSFE